MNNKYGTRWSDEEIEFLIRNAGKLSIEQIAKKLGRPYSSTAAKADEHGVANGKLLSRLFTANQLAKVLGVAASTICTWTDRMGLKYRWKRYRTSYQFKMIDINDFYEWGEEHQDSLDTRKFKAPNLGNEPEWLRQKRKSDALLPKKYNKPWARQEEQQLILFYELGISKIDIASRLNRTESGVQRKIDRLKALGELGIDKRGEFYTKTEVERLLALKEQGFTNKQIGQKLGRSKASVSHKYNKLKKDGG